MLRVALVLESGALRRELEALVRDDERFELASSVESFQDLAASETGPVDVAVVEAADSSIESVARAHAAGVSIVVMADGAEAARWLRELRAGVGVLPMTAAPEEIAAAIIAVGVDLIVVHPALEEEPPMHVEQLPEPLTARERQVLLELASGYGNKAIAARLAISDHTVKFHVAQILAKLGAGSRAEAVSIAMRRGLVPL